ncbi:hypothetical protein ES703_70767 [subsurface metagenome]
MGRYFYKRGKGTILPPAHTSFLGTELKATTATILTDSASLGVGLGNYPVSLFPSFDSFSYLSNLSGKLVSQNKRRPVGMFIMVDMNICSTYAGGHNLDEHLIIFDLWLLNLPQFHKAFPFFKFY